MKIFALIPLFPTLLAVAGCVPYPQTTSRFQGIRGTVIDAKTSQPIAGALVAIHDHPSTDTKTNAHGEFRLRSRSNFHLFMIPGICGEVLIPPGEKWSNKLDIYHPAYSPSTFDAGKNAQSEAQITGAMVKLKPQ